MLGNERLLLHQLLHKPFSCCISHYNAKRNKITSEHYYVCVGISIGRVRFPWELIFYVTPAQLVVSLPFFSAYYYLLLTYCSHVLLRGGGGEAG